MSLSPNTVYETRDVDFAAFLLYEGIEFLGCEKSLTNPNVILMRFQDAQGRCSDLQIVFLRTEFKKYRDLHKQLLSRIHEKLKKG